jgi:hypothetical protein
MLISASIWVEDTIQSDVWTEADDAPDPEVSAGLISNYYLKQMNFIGNVIQ